MNKKRIKIIALILGGLLFLGYYLWPIITNNDSPSQVSVSQEEGLEDSEERLAKRADRKSQTEELDSKGEYLVYITGAVAKPGLYELKEASSLEGLVKAAGGLLPYADTSQINLAEGLEAGSHVHIPFNFQGNPEVLLRGPLININTASESDLDTLPGIGPSTAKRIIEYREKNGQFSTIEDIKKVKGIGDGTFKKFSHKITV